MAHGGGVLSRYCEKGKKMKRRIIYLFGAFILGYCDVGLCLSSGSSNPQPMAASGQNWNLLSDFSDEFNGQELDRLKWKNNIGSWKTWSWSPENVEVQNGFLEITTRYSPHQRDEKTIYYTSGIVMNKKPILYGYFEARIKAASLHPGVCPAFWAWRKEKGQWTEIDFVELTDRYQNPKLVETNKHVFYHPELPPGKEIHEVSVFNASWDPRNDFHVYGCEWDEEQINWYIDGQLVANRKNDYWHQPLDLTISMGVRPPLSKKPINVGLPTAFQVDYVRVWQKNIAK